MKERITVNPGIHFGKPCVARTRIPVQSVLELDRVSFQISANSSGVQFIGGS